MWFLSNCYHSVARQTGQLQEAHCSKSATKCCCFKHLGTVDTVETLQLRATPLQKVAQIGQYMECCETWTCLLPVPGLSKDPFRLLIRPDFTSVLLSCGRQRIDHHRVIDMSHMTIISIMSQWATLNMAHTYSTHGHETHSTPCHSSLSVAAPQ